MLKPIIQITDFKGGMTLNEKMGREDQFHIGYGLDFSSLPGFLTCGPEWIRLNVLGNVSAASDFQGIIRTVKDNRTWLGADNTNLYFASTTNAIISAADSNQGGPIRGLNEYENFLYYPQDTTIGRKALASATSAGYTHNWQTGLTDDIYHPIFTSANKKQYIGHGSKVASWDNTTFTSSALDLAENWHIRTICDFGLSYLALGGNYYTTEGKSQKTKIFLWNRVDSSWNDEIIIPESEIQAKIFDSGYLWIFAGKNCSIYVVPEGSRKATKMWEFPKMGDIATNFRVYPNSVKAKNGKIYFGLSGGDTITDELSPCGIYCFPSDPSKFVLNRVDNLTAGTLATYDLNFYSLALENFGNTSSERIIASVRDSTGTIKRRLIAESIESSQFQGTADYESFKYDAPPGKKIHIEHIIVLYKPELAAGGDSNLDAYYKLDNDASWTQVITGFSMASGFEKIAYNINKTCRSLKLRLGIQGSTTNTLRAFAKGIYVTGRLIPTE